VARVRVFRVAEFNRSGHLVSFHLSLELCIPKADVLVFWDSLLQPGLSEGRLSSI
jgi:hypothetical protein